VEGEVREERAGLGEDLAISYINGGKRSSRAGIPSLSGSQAASPVERVER